MLKKFFHRLRQLYCSFVEVVWAAFLLNLACDSWWFIYRNLTMLAQIWSWQLRWFCALPGTLFARLRARKMLMIQDLSFNRMRGQNLAKIPVVVFFSWKYAKVLDKFFYLSVFFVPLFRLSGKAWHARFELNFCWILCFIFPVGFRFLYCLTFILVAIWALTPERELCW